MGATENQPKKKLIEPRTLKGFRDFLPEMMIPRETLIERVRKFIEVMAFVLSTPLFWNTWTF